MFSKPSPLQILTTDPFKQAFFATFQCVSLGWHASLLGCYSKVSEHSFRRVRISISTPICWRWFRTPLQTICSQETSWCGKSVRYFRNRSKKVKAWSSLSPMQLASIMCVPFIHPWATWCYHIMQITHCSKFHHLSKQHVRGGAAGTWASASRSAYLCNPVSWPWFYLLLWTENYYTAAAVANTELFPWKGCCELEVLQSNSFSKAIR